MVILKAMIEEVRISQGPSMQLLAPWLSLLLYPSEEIVIHNFAAVIKMVRTPWAIFELSNFL